MTLSEAQRTYLLGKLNFSALVGNRLFAEVGTQDTPRPYVGYHIEFRKAADTETVDPGDILFDAIVDYKIVSDDYDQAWQVEGVLRNLLSNFPGGNMGTLAIQACCFDGSEGGFAPEVDLFVVVSHFTFTFPPPQ